jgi:hypothetical protein
MKHTIIIVLEAIVIIALVVVLYRDNHQPVKVASAQGFSFQWPEAVLNGNERIIAASVTFQTTYIKGIRNLPPEWYVELNQNIPPNPVFKGSIIVGAAALFSANDLPTLEIEPFTKGEEAKAIKVDYTVSDLSSSQENERRIEINLDKS